MSIQTSILKKCNLNTNPQSKPSKPQKTITFSSITAPPTTTESYPKTKPKKSLPSLDKIIAKLDEIETNHTSEDPLNTDWIERIIVSNKLNLTFKLTETFFNIAKSQKDRNDALHIIKFLITVDEEDMITSLHSLTDLPIRLIYYIKETDISLINEDSFFILNFFFENFDTINYEGIKSIITQDFLMTMLNMLKFIKDDDNFLSAVKLLVEFNNFFGCDEKKNLFINMVKVNENKRIFIEVLIKLLNMEKDKGKIMKMFSCIKGILMAEKENIFYSNDMEIFVDIVINDLMNFYSEEVKAFIISTFELFTEYCTEYFIGKYKIDDVICLFDDFCNSENEGEVIKEMSRRVIKNISKYVEV